MASHGVLERGRYERLLRKHRLDTRNVDHAEPETDVREAVIPEQKTTRSQNLHDEWVAMHEKRQQAESPSTIVPPAYPQPTTITDAAETSTSTETEPATESISTADQQTTELPSETETGVEPTITTIAPLPTFELTTESDVESTTEGRTTDLPSVETTVATDPPAEFTPEPPSATESVSEVPGAIVTLTAETATASAPTDTFDNTASTTVPTTDSSETSDEDNISLTSSPDIPTAVAVSGNTDSISAESTSSETMIADTTSSESSDTTSTSTTSTTHTTEPTTTTTTASIPNSSSESTTDTAATTTTSYPSDPTYSNFPDGFGWGGGDGSDNTGGSGNNPGSDSTAVASPESTDSSGSGALSQQTTGKIVGGVVGGVAAVAVIFLLIFFLLRRRRKTGFSFGSPARVTGNDDSGGLAREPSTRQMVERDPFRDPDDETSFGAAYFAPAFMKRWRQSQQSAGEDSTLSSPPSERGFRKISGRKLPSGIYPGFEYSNGGPEAGSPTEPDISPTLPPAIPRSPPSSQPPPSNPFSHPLDSEVAEDDVVVMRPSPARVPTAGSSNSTSWGETSARTMAMAFPAPPSGKPASIPKRPDSLGRSHPSFDGSRGSRFTESL